MHTARPRSPIPDERQAEVLGRWGVLRCHLIDRGAFDAGLTRLLSRRPPAAEPSGIDNPLREGTGESVRRLLEDAVHVAQVCEGVHAAQDAWPHGLADDLDDLLQDLEAHDAREGLAYGKSIDAEAARLRISAGMIEHHRAIGEGLARLRRRTQDFRAPEAACAAWRLLYVLGHKIESELRAGMLLEKKRLLRSLLRNLPEA